VKPGKLILRCICTAGDNWSRLVAHNNSDASAYQSSRKSPTTSDAAPQRDSN
jgi:hypothetical protein